MKLALDRFADNPIVDELINRFDSQRPVKSLRACAPLWRKPFVEVAYRGSTQQDHMHFARDLFIHYWCEAALIIDTLTDIDLISEFQCPDRHNKEATVRTILSTRNACIRECDSMFESGLYQVFLDQFGANCRNLPEETVEKMKIAREKLG